MNSYFSYFEKKELKKAFFMGENTPEGFVPHMEDHVSEDGFSGVFILKGGPGTGKSTLLRRAAREAEEAGFTVTYLVCSSDPGSLDGITVERGEKKIAVIDGTAPHISDPVYPGACGETVDLFPALRTQKLTSQKEKIAELTRRKKECFAAAASYMRASRELILAREKLIREAYLREKADKYISRLCAGLGGKTGTGSAIRRQTLAFSCRGAYRISGFDGAGRKILLCDHACALPLFTESLASALMRRGEEVQISRSSLCGIGEIYLPSSDILFTPFADKSDSERVINMRRFTDAEKLSASRAKRSFSGKCIDMTVEEVLKNLSEAGKAHGELEKIYTPAVDFSVVDGIFAHLMGKMALSFELKGER